MKNNSISVQVIKGNDKFVLNSNIGAITLEVDKNKSNPNDTFCDFAVWFFLPIAMRLRRDLYIEGYGTVESQVNAKKLSEIWESWLPYHFSSINIKFKETLCKEKANDVLCFYSGGIDSTYSLLKRHLEGLNQDLITIHGMDYKVSDSSRFHLLKEKTQLFSQLVSKNQIYVKSDAYDLYRKYNVNPHGTHISHIFALAGNAFLFSERYQEICIAADYRMDQQFITYPYGSNSVTNNLFSDGITKLVTLDDNVTRCEKLPLLHGSNKALLSLSFCVDYKSRPLNCGICSKCLRTKVMFLSSTGHIPDIFKDKSIKRDWYKYFDLTSNIQKAFLLDILITAKSNNRSSSLPNFNKVYAYIKKKPFIQTKLAIKLFKIKRKIKKIFL